MKINGLYTAIITPFTSQNALDEEGLRKNIRFLIEGGVDGITALGTTGEAPTLTSHEKTRILEIVREETEGKVFMMVGTGSYSTEQTIQNTLHAQEMGADSAMIVVPYYNKPTQEGLYLHFKAVAAKVPDMPIIVYNHLGRTGQNMTTETLARLAEIPNIVAVKEASGNMSQIMEVIEEICYKRPHFSLLCGDDPLTLPAMTMGAHGVISVAGNLIPAEMHALVQAALQEDYGIARSIHYRLMPLFRAIFSETNPIGIKAAMDIMGMAAGPCRLPLCGLKQENYKKLETLLSTFHSHAR